MWYVHGAPNAHTPHTQLPASLAYKQIHILIQSDSHWLRISAIQNGKFRATHSIRRDLISRKCRLPSNFKCKWHFMPKWWAAPHSRLWWKSSRDTHTDTASFRHECEFLPSSFYFIKLERNSLNALDAHARSHLIFVRQKMLAPKCFEPIKFCDAEQPILSKRFLTSFLAWGARALLR